MFSVVLSIIGIQVNFDTVDVVVYLSFAIGHEQLMNMIMMMGKGESLIGHWVVSCDARASLHNKYEI